VGFAWALAWLTLDTRTLGFGGFTLEDLRRKEDFETWRQKLIQSKPL
jgi:hypothetical protein